MQSNIIKIHNTDRRTSLALKESTKRELESLGRMGETQEDIILRLIRLAKTPQTKTKIEQQGGASRTTYGKVTRKFIVEIAKTNYTVLCQCNDLSLMSAIKQINPPELSNVWEVDLEIINIGDKNQWMSHINKKTDLLLYLVCIKQILEETFGVKVYELQNEQQYLDLQQWRMAYERLDFSMESFYSDIERKLHA